ncbi:proteasome subunit beta [archaeon]|mgnify:CR=1 FL=1|nr:proteasome subunit beta [archaeon]|tara:strand:- start:1737 stop:2366 length:630 start_codon:yes stop_codon:yes gene_type:complete
MDAKKGTTTLGIVCKDGVVLAADRRVSAGYLIANRKVKKVLPVSEHMGLTTAGLVSDIQLFTKIIKAQITLMELRKGKEPQVKEAANLLANLAYSNIRRPSMIPGIVGFLFAGWDNKIGYQLYEIAFDGSVLDVDDYASDGSGSVVTLGVMETLFKKGMTVEEGKELAVKAISTAIDRDLATGDGIDVLLITEKGAKYVFNKEIKKTLV